MKRLIPFFLLLNSAWAIPAIHENQSYYSISGRNAADLRTQINALGPVINGKHFDSKTSWHVNWRYEWHYDNPSQSPCYVTRVVVTADIVTTAPMWVNKSVADMLLQNKWDTYLVNLKNHENGHINNGKRAAIEIENAMLNMPPKSNCRELNAALDNKGYEIIHEHNLWDIQYDADTNHGRNQGARFP